MSEIEPYTTQGNLEVSDVISMSAAIGQYVVSAEKTYFEDLTGVDQQAFTD